MDTAKTERVTKKYRIKEINGVEHFFRKEKKSSDYWNYISISWKTYIYVVRTHATDNFNDIY